MKRRFRFAALSMLFALTLSGCDGAGSSSSPTPEPTASPIPYDIEFNLPVTELDMALVRPDTWAAVDGLGRTLSSYGDSYASTLHSGTVPETKSDKYVGIFYSSWHEELAKSNRARNITELLAEFTEEEREVIKHDFSNKVWGGYTGYHFWDEPIYGYYSTADKYVLRKQAELLADADVDVIIFDCTNGSFTWKTSYVAICEAFTQARKEGVDTPQIAFMLNFGAQDTTRTMLLELWNDMYSKDLYKDLWFYWEGKPLMIGYPGALKSTEKDQAIREFFNFKLNDGSYFMQDGDESHWGWLSTYPQAAYYNADGTVEQVTVGVAQNADYVRQCLTAMSGNNVMGRSYTKGDYSYTYSYKGTEITVNSDIENSKYYGLNFQQQWDYAMSLDPEFIYVTGWNEWIALRMQTWAGDTTLENCIVDQYDTEYSRDCEPSAGELKDYYYYQLCENVRRFKGVSVPEQQEANRTIDVVNGKTSQWLGITSYYSYLNNTWVRSRAEGSRGYSNKVYKNETMRNDIVTSKIAFDNDNMYFYVDTADVLTPYTDEGWMRLFIDTDQSGNSANWEGFEYVVNRVNPSSETECTLERSKGGWDWETVGTITYSAKSNVLQICIPRTMLGLSTGGAPSMVTFKWCDNNLIGEEEGNIMNLYQDGDVAPGARFTFVLDPARVTVY